MNPTRFALHHRAFVIALSVLLVGYGLLQLATMSRRENPELLIRVCVVQTPWQGASAEKVEALVTDPLETAISKIDEIKRTWSESRQGVSLIFVEMEEWVTDVDQLWDEVRSQVNAAAPRLPDGAGPPFVNADFGDVSDVVLAVHQVPPPGATSITRPYSYRELELLTETLQDELKTIPSVAKVDVFGVQEEVLHVEIDAADWSKIELTTTQLRTLLSSRNIVASGGVIDDRKRRFAVTPTGEFTSVDQIPRTIVALGETGLPIELGDLPVQIRREHVDPPTTLFRHLVPGSHAGPCLLLALTMKAGSNVVDMGTAVREHLARLSTSTLPPDLRVAHINDLPHQVDGLVSDFITNLWQAMVIVVGVALLMMGWRAGLIMATAIPLSMLSALAIVPSLGVELEQFSIASLIIAMGMVVDNAIVVSDNTLSELARKGQGRRVSVLRGASDLAIPILTSTLTTVAAFGGMLTIIGNVGEFTRSLPIVVAVTLLSSYVVAMTVTPLLCFVLLRVESVRSRPVWWRRAFAALAAKVRRPVKGPPRGGLYARGIRWCARHRFLTLGTASLAVIGALALVPLIGNEFFPGGIRNQFFIHVWLPEGSSIHATSDVCRSIENILLETSKTTVEGVRVERLESATTMIGTGGPRLTLTLQPEQTYPNYAHVLVRTTDPEFSRAWAGEVRAATALIPGARIDVREYELGPYVSRPVEFRLLGDDPTLLRKKGEEMVGVLRRTPGTVNPYSDWRNSSYRAHIEVDHEAANMAGVTNLNIADTMDSLISGGYLTTYREGDHQVRVLLRLREDKRARLLEGLAGIFVNGRSGKVPLGSIAKVVTDWQPSVIARRNQRRCISVGCLTEPGFLAPEVAASARPDMERLLEDLPATHALEAGGSSEQVDEAQGKLTRAFGLSFLLIIVILIAQYNAFAMPLVVLSSIPLAAVGALLGLFSTGWALGFMPSLGIIALAGVVINNAIILIDAIEGRLREGVPFLEALEQAGTQRTRPIFLSTLTTVGGLIPLALFAGPMWAGMAWAMIFGLLISTVMTLFVTPTLYAFVAETLGWRRIEPETPLPNASP